MPTKDSNRRGNQDVLCAATTYIKRCGGHTGVHLIRPRFLDILRILGFALLEVMVETNFADDVQPAIRSTSAVFVRVNL